MHPDQISDWKSIVVRGISEQLASKGRREDKSKDELIEGLYRQIGQLKVEVDRVKKIWI